MFLAIKSEAIDAKNIHISKYEDFINIHSRTFTITSRYPHQGNGIILNTQIIILP